MSTSSGTVNSYLPKMIVREETAANTTVPPLPAMTEEFRYGGPWMDPQWKKDLRTTKKLFSAYPIQMAVILVLTACLAAGLGFAGKSCAGSTNAAEKNNDSFYSDDYIDDYTDDNQNFEVNTSDGLLGTENAAIGSIGNVSVSINGYKFAKDYNDIDSVMIEYTFTNNDSESTYFYYLDHRAYQNGVQLTNSYGKTNEYDNQEQILEVLPGGTHTVHCLYNLNNATDPVEVSVTDLLQLRSGEVFTTFSL